MISPKNIYCLADKSTVAYQGESGAYSELAIGENLKNGIACPKRSFEEIFQALLDASVSYGMIPVRNSIVGKVEGVEELIQKYRPIIIHEIQVAIEHCLIVNPGVNEINSVYSHIQALKQCRKYITNNSLIQIPYYDTAGAVKLIKDRRLLDAGAIASKLAAYNYDMEILEYNLGSVDNVTTFYLIQLENS